MELTKRQEKQLNKVFNDPKKLRKWIDEVYNEMIMRCQEQTRKMILRDLDIYSITVAYTLRYVCGFGKKRLPEIMNRIWNNVDSFRTGHLDILDCIKELKENGVNFDGIIQDKSLITDIIGGKDNVDKQK